MSYRIACLTLFDITRTGVMNRSTPNNADLQDWVNRRNTQCNFDTILQVISLRSQPEVIKMPTKKILSELDLLNLGSSFHASDADVVGWEFQFEVQHPSVFDNGEHLFEYLYNDCDQVPMIMCDTQTMLTTSFLNISPELKNIHFEII